MDVEHLIPVENDSEIYDSEGCEWSDSDGDSESESSRVLCSDQDLRFMLHDLWNLNGKMDVSDWSRI